MKKAISYSLFGYNQERNKDSFDFNSYLRGLLINLKCQALIYPDWEIVLNTDKETYNGLKDLFDLLPIKILINEEVEPLTKSMLWRMKPIWLKENDQFIYSHIICRDLDSPLTLRERKCVEEWIIDNSIVHAITDSISHNIPMMGGMVGFKPKEFIEATSYTTFEEMFADIPYDFDIKGTDQELLCRHIYPIFCRNEVPINGVYFPSIMQHYLKGYPNTNLKGFRNIVPEWINVGLDLSMEESNEICGHIGSAGWYEPKINVFLTRHKEKIQHIIEIEKKFTDIFWWAKEIYN
jgi:hypothetical protein